MSSEYPEQIPVQDQQIKEEIERIGVSEKLIAVMVKPEVIETFSFVPEIVYLPLTFFPILRQKGINEELVAAGLGEAINFLRPFGPTRLLADSLLSYAQCLRFDSWNTVLDLTLESINIYQQHGKARPLGRAYVTLASVLTQGNLPYDALHSLEIAEKILIQDNDKIGVITCQYHRGRISRRLSLPNEALFYFGQAEKKIASMPSSQSLGTNWLTRIRSEKISAYLELGNDLLALQEIEKWIQAESKNEQYNQEKSYFPFWSRASLLKKSGKISLALKDFIEASKRAYLEIIKQNTPSLRLELRYKLDHVFRDALSTAIDANNPEIAIGLHELSKAMSEYSIERVQPLLNVSSFRSLVEKERRGLKESAHNLTKQINTAINEQNQPELEKCYRKVEQILSRREIILSQQDDYGELHTIETLGTTIQEAIPENVLILDYSVFDEYLYILAISRNQITLKQTNVLLQEMSILIESYNHECRTLLPTFALNKISSELMIPMASQIKNSETIYIIPVGNLFGIPFHAFDWEESPLLQKHRIIYQTSSMETIGQIKTGRLVRINRDSRCTVFGVPDISYSDAQELPGVYDETRLVSSFFSNPQCFIGNEATSHRLFELPNDTDVLHIACHAQFDPKYPLFSKILLADRPVFAFEILLENYDLELVVLNSCRSGEARTYVSGDKDGLADAFRKAGTKSVVATSWAISDEVATIFMNEFYRELLLKSESPVNAMRSAQLSIRKIKEFEHPFFWAPFVVFGSSF